MERINIQVIINGSKEILDVPPNLSLLNMLRENFSLTGTKNGCEAGECGACTVLMNGKAVRSCTMRVGSAQGKSIVTIEGLASGDILHPMQAAFLAEGAIQCGYCTPGMVLTTKALLERNSSPIPQ